MAWASPIPYCTCGGRDLDKFRSGPPVGRAREIKQGVEIVYKRMHLTCPALLAAAKAEGAFDAKTLSEVEAFLTDPAAWRAAHE